MPPRLVTPVRRDIVLALFALGVLAGPLWASQLALGEPTYRYERAEVTANETTVEYADLADRPPGEPISDQIVCSGDWTRPCAFEQLLLDGRTVPSGYYYNNPDGLPPIRSAESLYGYVRIDDAIYEPSYVTNESAQREDGMYRVDLDLERADPERALRVVSVRETSDDLPSTVVETARSGEGRSTRPVDVPETPIRLEDGTYYRVYQASHTDPSPASELVDFLATYLAPFVGLVTLGRLWERLEVTYAD